MATNKVLKMEDILKDKEIVQEKVEKNREEKSVSRKKKKVKQKSEIPKGKPKSGRVWKSQKTKFSTIVKTKGIRNSFARKEALRKELARIKEVSRSLLEKKKEEKEAKKQRRRENLKRREENRKKSEVVQVIKNTSKIKRMKKKQLRYIEKRDTNDM